MSTEKASRKILIDNIIKSRNGEPSANRKIVFPENDDEEMSRENGKTLNRKSEKDSEKCDGKDPFVKLLKYIRSKHLEPNDCMNMERFEKRYKITFTIEGQLASSTSEELYQAKIEAADKWWKKFKGEEGSMQDLFADVDSSHSPEIEVLKTISNDRSNSMPIRKSSRQTNDDTNKLMKNVFGSSKSSFDSDSSPTKSQLGNYSLTTPTSPIIKSRRSSPNSPQSNRTSKAEIEVSPPASPSSFELVSLDDDNDSAFAENKFKSKTVTSTNSDMKNKGSNSNIQEDFQLDDGHQLSSKEVSVDDLLESSQDSVKEISQVKRTYSLKMDKNKASYVWEEGSPVKKGNIGEKSIESKEVSPVKKKGKGLFGRVAEKSSNNQEASPVKKKGKGLFGRIVEKSSESKGDRVGSSNFKFEKKKEKTMKNFLTKQRSYSDDERSQKDQHDKPAEKEIRKFSLKSRATAKSKEASIKNGDKESESDGEDFKFNRKASQTSTKSSESSSKSSKSSVSSAKSSKSTGNKRKALDENSSSQSQDSSSSSGTLRRSKRDKFNLEEEMEKSSSSSHGTKSSSRSGFSFSSADKSDYKKLKKKDSVKASKTSNKLMEIDIFSVKQTSNTNSNFSKYQSKNPRDENLAPSGSTKYSDVFKVEDDPFVVALNRREEKRMEKNAKERERRRGKKHRASMSQMIELSTQSYEDQDSRSSKEDNASRREQNSKSKKKSKSKKEESSKGLQTLDKFMSKSKKKPVKEEREEEEYEPTVDDLLALPTQEGDDGRTMDEILDEVDKEIAEQRERHRKELESIERNTEKQKKLMEERKARYQENSLLKERLWSELSHENLIELFQNNLDYLKDIERGNIESTRHKAFFNNPRSRQGLMYTMITHPFSEQHVDWTYALMKEVWMSTKQLQVENNEYVWKVLLPECFIKFYMDFFAFSKKEAEQRIKETPLDDDSSSSEDEL